MEKKEDFLTIESDYIIWKIVGKMTLEELQYVLNRADDLNLNSKDYAIVADVSDLENISMDCRKYGIRWLQGPNSVPVSVIGCSSFMKFLIEKIILVSGVGKTVKIFNAKKDALQWMKTVQLKKN